MAEEGLKALTIDRLCQHLGDTKGTRRDIDIVSGHVVFDYDVSRELAGALEIGANVPPFAIRSSTATDAERGTSDEEEQRNQV